MVFRFRIFEIINSMAGKKGIVEKTLIMTIIIQLWNSFSHSLSRYIPFKFKYFNY